ncbi:hypothetical protein HAHE_20710 [Haloferula helveola]|uniref:Uncharacterized protein n=2 Tax=Haloferula helveola TaxID=490095 RepID=A0ABN6H4Y8_9BACT|nr:hypothetical protein HAHE_20710 [Haloferula helveola]
MIVLGLLALPAFGGEAPVLKQDNAKKTEVRHSMLGPRDTLLFYAFGDSAAVLRLQIPNDSAKFSVKGSVVLFADGTDAEALAKWINNQHSDGLFADAPQPSATIELPEGVCEVAESKFTGEKQSGRAGESYGEYEVTVRVKDHEAAGKFKLKAFTEKAGVLVKAGKS